jgi:16S rRNA (guanine(1405)-N(7))-methyltransferase
MNTGDSSIDKLVRHVLRSWKYKHVCKEFVRHIGTKELSIRRNYKEAIKATKKKMHQIGGAYFEARIPYTRAIEELTHVKNGNKDDFSRVCKELMRLHASTKERIEILEEFYTTTLGAIQPIRVVLDIACGLNPLAIPWMPLDEGATYYAYDIYKDMLEFIQAFMRILGIDGYVEMRDVTQSPPTQKADVALILKTLPCLEQVDKTAGLRLLENVKANHVLVSFPVHSLGGWSKGMVANYEQRFSELIQAKPWTVQRFTFATELVFLIKKNLEILI